MRTRVKCVNCGTIWDKVENTNSSVEFTQDLMLSCPKCRSNAYETKKDNAINKALDKFHDEVKKTMAEKPSISETLLGTEHKEKPYTTKAQENIKCSVRHKEKILNKHSKITHKEGKQEERKCEIWDKVCPVCGGDTAIRNPTGKCDHLYYPDNVKQEVKEGDIEKIFVKDEMEKWESELFEALSMLIGELISNNLITSEEKYSMIFEYGQNINKCVISEYKSSLINNIKGRLEDLKVNPKDETMWENDNYDYEIEFDRGIDEAIKILEDM